MKTFYLLFIILLLPCLCISSQESEKFHDDDYTLAQTYFTEILKDEQTRMFLSNSKNLEEIRTNPQYNQDRSIFSKIELLKFYQENNPALFNAQELSNLEQIAQQKIIKKLDIFQRCQSDNAKKFLTIANKNNLLTQEQKILFEQLTYTPPAKPTIFKTMAFCSVIIIFFILKNIYNI